jgi:hypothetical protein
LTTVEQSYTLIIICIGEWPPREVGSITLLKQKMETPSQIIYGLGSFIIACLGMVALCYVSARFSFLENSPAFMGYALLFAFFMMWWVSFFWLIAREKRNKFKKDK